MINLKYKNELISVPTNVYEFNITQFEQLFMVLKDNQIKLFDKWVSIFKIVGIPDELINSLDIDEFNEIVTEFKFDLALTDIKPKIILNNIEYSCYDKKFDISVKDYILISNYLGINPLTNITKVLAILYKSKDEIKNKTEFTRTYIEDKAIKFKTVSADYAIPVYNLLNKILIVQSIIIENE